MTTQELYYQLKQIELFKDKISLLKKDDPENIFFGDSIKLYFHEHLTLLIVVEEMHQECCIDYNRLTHCHIEAEEILDELMYLAKGNLIFIGWGEIIEK